MTAVARVLADRTPDRLVLLAAPLLLPWTVVPTGGAVSLVFPWGLVSAWPLPTVTVPLWRYLATLTAGLPAYLRAWPISTVLYACALASTSPLVRPPVDDDGTAVLLAFAGLAHLGVSVGIWRSGRFAIPLGTVVLWSLAFAVYEDHFR
jgi:uncharacterized protein (TIGR04206 family)